MGLVSKISLSLSVFLDQGTGPRIYNYCLYGFITQVCVGIMMGIRIMTLRHAMLPAAFYKYNVWEQVAGIRYMKGISPKCTGTKFLRYENNSMAYIRIGTISLHLCQGIDSFYELFVSTELPNNE